MDPANTPIQQNATQQPSALDFWIRTPCGRAKYQELAARPGLLSRLRLCWFVLIAALRDLGQPLPQAKGEGGDGGEGPAG